MSNTEYEGSFPYWNERYKSGGNSGVGSYGKFAVFKAEVINDFVERHNVKSVIEFGCGDGAQLALARYPEYTGFDISGFAIEQCRRRFQDDLTKRFSSIDEYSGETAELGLSLDVLFHLTEDNVFEEYLYHLFNAAERFVMIYSSNTDANDPQEAAHVHHRAFTDWVDEHLAEWKLLQHIPNRYPYNGNYLETSFSDFFIYDKA
jgi:SAM-dependent methyltransferase